MEKQTLQHPFIVDYLNKHFYCIKLDGKYRGIIKTRGQDYTFADSIGVDEEGHHELVIALTGAEESISYPSAVFMEKNLDVIQVLPGNLSPRQLEVFSKLLQTVLI